MPIHPPSPIAAAVGARVCARAGPSSQRLAPARRHSFENTSSPLASDDDIALAEPASESTPSPSPPPPAHQQPAEDGQEQQPILAPLEPPYEPYQRRPTPPGFPSYEEAQARMVAQQRRGGHGSRAAVDSRRSTPSASGGGGRRALIFWQRSTAPPDDGSATPPRPRRHAFVWNRAWGPPAAPDTRRHGQQHDASDSNNNNNNNNNGSHSIPLTALAARIRNRTGSSAHTHAHTHTHTPSRPLPVWRPPASQHALDRHHPFLQDGPASPPAQPSSPPQSSMLQAVLSAAATAETDARAGREARPVTLDDYRFMQEQAESSPALPDGGGGDGAGAGGGRRTTHRTHHTGGPSGQPPRGRRGSSGVRRIRNTMPPANAKPWGCSCFACLRWCLVPWPPRAHEMDRFRRRFSRRTASITSASAL